MAFRPDGKYRLTTRCGSRIYSLAMSRLGILLVASMLAAGHFTIARADIYMYRDSKGTLHFSNAPTGTAYRQYMSDDPIGRPKAAGSWRIASRASRKAFEPMIADSSRRHHVDPALVTAVIQAESNFVPYAKSPKGAIGLMQLMPATARMHGVWQIYDPRENVEGGVRHLRLLLDRYNGNVRLALAAYNAGIQAVERHGGVPPYKETTEYLQRVLRFRDQYVREQ